MAALALHPGGSVLLPEPLAGEQLTAPSTIEQSNATFYVYFTRIPTTNARHSLDRYVGALEVACASVRARGLRARLLGEAEWIASATNSCRPLLDPDHGDVSYADLPALEEASDVSPMCDAKVSVSGHYPKGNYRHMSAVWLSKLPLLCSRAVKRPDEISVMLDARIADEQQYYTEMLAGPSRPTPGIGGSVIDVAIDTAKDHVPGTIGCGSRLPYSARRDWELADCNAAQQPMHAPHPLTAAVVVSRFPCQHVLQGTRVWHGHLPF